MKRTVKNLHKPEYSKIGDLITYNVIPGQTLSVTQVEPFLFLNHHGWQVYKPHNSGLPFGPHPHKGFETVTFILKGDILHKDSGGHESVITEGGIQWMTAGSGLIHSEVSSKEFMEKGGELEILQLWINLPARFKKAAPQYIGLQKDQIPALTLDEGKVTVNLIAGKWEGAMAPVQSLTEVCMATIYFRPGGKLTTVADASRTIFLYVVKGHMKINGKEVTDRTLVEFASDGETADMEAADEAVILYGHAEPTREPVVARGPFVMNSMEEIREAYQEYQEGKFGRWE